MIETAAGQLHDSADIRRQLEEIHAGSYGWALSCCGFDRDEAQEVLQAAYLKAIDGRATFEGRSCFRTWFFGVVRRTALEARRSRLVRGVALARWIVRRPAAGGEPTPEAIWDWAQTRDRLVHELERLSPRQRDLLHLVFYQELTIEQSAEVLGISIGTARTHYERGKARLRERLRGAEENYDVPSRA